MVGVQRTSTIHMHMCTQICFCTRIDEHTRTHIHKHSCAHTCQHVHTLGTFSRCVASRQAHITITSCRLQVESIHGQLRQNVREKALNDFKAGKIHTLCATDVAARGIHIKKLQHVINYDFPTNIDQYCHRVGRTGRQGEEGCSYSLITRNMAPMVGDLVDLLRSCGQEVEPNLEQLASDYRDGMVDLSQEEVVEDGGEQ